MKKASSLMIVGVVAAALITGLTQVEAQSQKAQGNIVGLWLRQVPSGIGGVNGKEGFLLKKDGTYEFVGIATMNGIRWRVQGRNLIMTSNTERYPEPTKDRYIIEGVGSKTLKLGGAGYLKGIYHREDPATSKDLADWRATLDKILLENTQAFVKHTDGRLAGLKKQEKQLTPEKKGWEPRKLVLWTEKGIPVKFWCTEPDDLGKMELPGTSFYYKGGKLSFAKFPFNGLIFRNGQVVLWINERWQPLHDIPSQDMNNAGAGTIKRSKKYLKLFKH
jgi:hypothetical protein